MTFTSRDRNDETQPWQCDCENHAELRRRRMANGALCVGLQCLRCGNWEIRRRADHPDIGDLHWFDEPLRDRWVKTQSERASAEQERQRAEQNAEWWRKYNAYLRSPAWAAKRAKVLMRAGGMCECCLERRATEVHHTTYEHVCHEPLWELRAICKHCHERLTEFDRARRAR